MATANEIKLKAAHTEEDGDKKVSIDSMDFSYLVRMAEALEQINAVQQRVYSGELDGFDFGEKVEDILRCV